MADLDSVALFTLIQYVAFVGPMPLQVQEKVVKLAKYVCEDNDLCHKKASYMSVRPSLENLSALFRALDNIHTQSFLSAEAPLKKSTLLQTFEEKEEDSESSDNDEEDEVSDGSGDQEVLKATSAVGSTSSIEQLKQLLCQSGAAHAFLIVNQHLSGMLVSDTSRADLIQMMRQLEQKLKDENRCDLEAMLCFYMLTEKFGNALALMKQQRSTTYFDFSLADRVQKTISSRIFPSFHSYDWTKNGGELRIFRHMINSLEIEWSLPEGEIRVTWTNICEVFVDTHGITRAFVMISIPPVNNVKLNGFITIVFTGTDSFPVWYTDLSFFERKVANLDIVGEVHGGIGFMFEKINCQIKEFFEKVAKKFKMRFCENHVPHFELIITGHSLGGALAHLMAFVALPEYFNIRCRLVSTTGCPCIFRKAVKIPTHTLITNYRDARDIVFLTSSIYFKSIGDDCHFHCPNSQSLSFFSRLSFHTAEVYSWIHTLEFDKNPFKVAYLPTVKEKIITFITYLLIAFVVFCRDVYNRKYV